MTTACFQSDGIEPSALDLFMSMVRGLAIASEPSFRRRAGVSASPVDLEDLIFFNSVLTNSSLIVDNLNLWRVLGESVVLRDGAENTPLIFWTAVPK